MSFYETVRNPQNVDSDDIATRFTTLDALQLHHEVVYGERDRTFLSDPFARIRLFGAATADLFDAMRRDPDQEDLEVMFGRLVGRIFSIANGNVVLVSEGMMRKFPLEGCVNCQSKPCVCTAKRPDATLGVVNDMQREWSLSKWQSHLHALYNDVNMAPGKGKWFVACRLTVETNELQAEQDKFNTIPQEDFRGNMQLEVADCLAWTAAVANVYDTDLERSYLNRFGLGCPTCGQSKCVCDRHNFQPVKFA